MQLAGAAETRTEADRRAWEDKVKAMRMLYETKNSNYWRDEIAASKGNTRHLGANVPRQTGRGIPRRDWMSLG